jgi:hypothetical protein
LKCGSEERARNGGKAVFVSSALGGENNEEKLNVYTYTPLYYTILSGGRFPDRGVKTA